MHFPNVMIPSWLSFHKDIQARDIQLLTLCIALAGPSGTLEAPLNAIRALLQTGRNTTRESFRRLERHGLIKRFVTNNSVTSTVVKIRPSVWAIQTPERRSNFDRVLTDVELRGMHQPTLRERLKQSEERRLLERRLRHAAVRRDYHLLRRLDPEDELGFQKTRALDEPEPIHETGWPDLK